MAQFSEGVWVQYKHHIGIISFLCETSLSIKVHEFPGEPIRDVIVVVSRSDWKNIKLIKESDK
jgi:hypothetical protein